MADTIADKNRRINQLRCPECGKLRVRSASGWVCPEWHSRVLPYCPGDTHLARISRIPEANPAGKLWRIGRKLFRRVRQAKGAIKARVKLRAYWFVEAERGSRRGGR